jgi:hypothetical protein
MGVSLMIGPFHMIGFNEAAYAITMLSSAPFNRVEAAAGVAIRRYPLAL